MNTYTLVVSNPPHAGVDPAVTAHYFGLTPAEARMKTNFPAPEIWFADADQKKMEETASALRERGVSSVVLAGEDLLRVPARTLVTSFTFGDSELVAQSEGSELTIAYDTSFAGVFAKPPSGVTQSPRKVGSLASDLGRPSTSVMMDRLSGAAAAGSITAEREATAFLDLYGSFGGEERRVSFVDRATDFSGLVSRTRDVLTSIVAECERRFASLEIDRRLENIRPRQSATVAGPHSGQEKRKLFAYGTVALSQLLEAISPELKDLTQYELGSRLSFLME